MFSESGLHQRSEREQFIRKDEKDQPEVRRRSYVCNTLVAWHVTQYVTQALVTDSFRHIRVARVYSSYLYCSGEFSRSKVGRRVLMYTLLPILSFCRSKIGERVLPEMF
jgi:hypothetical protein